MKLAVVKPATTVTEDGVVKEGLLADSVTTALPGGAAADNVTVHVEVEPEVTVAGEHCRPAMLTAGDRTVIVPPFPVTAIPVPLGSAPREPFTEIGTVEPLAADPNPTVTVATVPLLIAVTFMPIAKHVSVPVPALHVRLLPAPVKAGPAATVIDAILPGA